MRSSHSSSPHHYLPWGIAWGVAWGSVLSLASATPALYRLESDLQMRLLQSRLAQPVAADIVILGIDGQVDGSDGQAVDFFLDRTNYAGLALRLLEEARASVVVLNLPSSFVVPQTLWNENLDAPLKNVVQQYPDRLVFATRSSESFRQAEINIYNHFLPFSSLSLEYVVEPEVVQGVVQYQLDQAGILRSAQVGGVFKRRDSQTLQTFPFVESLTLGKYDPDLAWHLFQNNQGPFQFNPLNVDQSIPIIPIEAVCPPQPVDPCLEPVNSAVLEQLNDRIVLVGFVDGYPETFPITTAAGNQIAAVELQAQILSSFLRQEFYYVLPLVGSVGILFLVAVGTGVVVMSTSDSDHPFRLSTPQKRTLYLGLGIILYEGWAITQGLVWRWLWPLGTPVIAWGLTAVSVVLTRILIQNRERLQSQQQELEQLRRAEQEAAVDQARKLLYRVSSDIHDQELQELKLAMDAIETVQWQQQQGQTVKLSTYDDLLQQLERIGQGIRNQLNNVRILASKLSISPSLRDGLHAGIAHYLETLRTTGVLTLPLKTDLHPLQEPTTSEWLDQREDILRFLREAMANVVSHVQPPRGSATYVVVQLKQVNQRCYLYIINDGIEYVPNHRGGYGTKAMNTIAGYLPQGTWQRRQTPVGEVHVELQWDIPGFERPGAA